MRVALLKEGSDEQLQFVSPTSRLIYERADALIGISAPANTRSLMTVDPARMALFQKSAEDLMATQMRRTEAGDFAWTAVQFPTEAAAQDAGMPLEDYAAFVYGACLLNEDDPVRAWGEQEAMQSRLIDWISPRRTVHITGPGTDLTVGVAGRTWINDEGRLNCPGGEIFTGPIEDQTEGAVQFSFPAYYAGREVTGVRLQFERGRVVSATADTGEDFLRAMLDMDEGARRLGEFAFGTNDGITQFTKNVLFDEKIGGTCHMALGRAYPETGGQNASALHWDMVCDLKEAEVTVDGELFSKGGQFVV
jgi:aminopeptidase